MHVHVCDDNMSLHARDLCSITRSSHIGNGWRADWQVPLLTELMQFERFRIAESMEVRKYEDGNDIVKEGDAGSEFFIIQTGNCHCFKKTLKF
jgi:hypothetical protein